MLFDQKNEIKQEQCIIKYKELEKKYQDATSFFNDDEKKIAEIKFAIIRQQSTERCNIIQKDLSSFLEKCNSQLGY